MQARLRSLSAAIGALLLVTAAVAITGCGQSGPKSGEVVQSGNEPAQLRPDASAKPLNPASPDADVQAASAQARRVETNVEPAVVATPEGASPGTASGARTPLPLEEPIDSGQAMPQVFLTEAHAKTCLVKVGDQMPALDLPSVDGTAKKFGDLLGKKLTIVCFWNGRLPTSLEELADLESRFLGEFGGDGLAVIGVNVGDDPKLAQELAGQAQAKFVNLSDRDGKAFAQVATEKLPRTYLLDASGKVLWFDLEYSRATRQGLLSAIRFATRDQ
jgi:peroxiredoxin